MSTSLSSVHFLVYFYTFLDIFYTFLDIFCTFFHSVNNSNSSSASSSTDSIEPELLFNRNSGHFSGHSPSFGSTKKSPLSVAKGSKTPSSVGSEASSAPQELECRLLLDQVLNEKKLVISN